MDFTIPKGATLEAVNDGKGIKIQPQVITPATKVIPISEFVRQLTAQRDELQVKIDEINEQLDSITNQGVDMQAVLTQLGKEV